MYDDEYYRRIRRNKRVISSHPVYQLRQGSRRIATFQVEVGQYDLWVDNTDVESRHKIEMIISEGLSKTTKDDYEAYEVLNKLWKMVHNGWKMQAAFKMLEQKVKEMREEFNIKWDEAAGKEKGCRERYEKAKGRFKGVPGGERYRNCLLALEQCSSGLTDLTEGFCEDPHSQDILEGVYEAWKKDISWWVRRRKDPNNWFDNSSGSQTPDFWDRYQPGKRRI